MTPLRLFSLAVAVAATVPGAAAEPSPAAAPGSATPASQPSAGSLPADYSFYRSQAAAADTPSRWSGGLALSLGKDSNILRENPDLPESTDASGTTWSVEGQAQVRAIQGSQGRVTVGGTAALDDYPTEHSADLVRYGGFLAGAWTPAFLNFEPGAILSRHQFRLDNQVTADATTLNLFATWARERYVAIAGGSLQRLDYRQDPDATGRFFDLSYRHWFLLVPNQVSRRIEVGLRLGSNLADGDADRYRVIAPSAAAFYRLGPDGHQDAGSIDLSLRTTYELRSYDNTDAGDDHQSSVFALRGQADYWWNRWFSTGVYAGTTHRGSTEDAEVFSRNQAGIRLAASW